MEIPIAFKDIPTSSWSIVKTSQDKEFYYNKETKESVWNLPSEIADLVNFLLQAAMESEEIPVDNETELVLNIQETVPEPVIAKPIPSPQESALLFTQMLHQLEVSPLSTWAVEEQKLKNDSRYSQVESEKERKQLYEAYCGEMTDKILQEKKAMAQDAKSIYKTLLETETNHRTLWLDFSRKFKRDSRFIRIDSASREAMFNDHLAIIKERKRQEIISQSSQK